MPDQLSLRKTVPGNNVDPRVMEHCSLSKRHTSGKWREKQGSNLIQWVDTFVLLLIKQFDLVTHGRVLKLND